MSSVEVPSVGDLLAERYRLEEHVGGADGHRQLWRGVDVLLHRSVAVVLRYPGGEDAGPMLTAAVAASRAQTDSMVDVYDAVDEGRVAYVVREWVDGSSLRGVLERQPLAPAHALELVASVADAVATLHTGDVAHGDLQPASIMLSEDDRVMVCEPRNEPGHTTVGDVRALGATLYACLTGAWPQVVPAEQVGLPYAATDQWGRTVDAAQVNPNVPDALNRLTADLLDPAEAPPTTTELAAELRRLAQTGGAGPLDAITATPVAGRPESPPRGMKRLALVAAITAGVVFGGVITSALVWGGDDDPEPGGGDSLGLTGDDTSATEDADGDQTTDAGPVEAELGDGDYRVVDPGGDRTELEGIEAAFDGNSGTGWSTDTYNGSDFGNLKPGMGVLIDLGEQVEVSSVRVQMTSAGATIGLLGGEEDPGDSTEGDERIASEFATLAEPVEDADTNLELQAGDQTRYVVVWITDLPPASGGYKITITDIKVFVR